MSKIKMSNNAVIHDIGTAVPDYECSQDQLLELMLRLLGDKQEKRNFLTKIYNGSRIKKRYSVIKDYISPPEGNSFYPNTGTFLPEPDIERRNNLYNQESGPLAARAAEDAFAESQFRPGDITHLITVSCTGFKAPGVDFHLIDHCGMNRNVQRFHIGFMGCYAAFPALNLAGQIANNDPSAVVLVVNVELCTVHFQQKFDLQTQVSNALFADGAAAMIVADDSRRNGKPVLRINSFLSEFIPGSGTEMGWNIGNTAFDMTLSAKIPRLIGDNADSFTERFLKETGLTREDINFWAIHPGGDAILKAFYNTLGLSEEDLKESYSVLSDYGNMSSVTIVFIWKMILAAEGNGEIFAAGFGPGLTVEMAHLTKEQ